MGQIIGYELAVVTADSAALLRGIAIGVAVAAPVGPMSLLCMRRTLTRGWRYGLATGGGIAAGDTLYALVAALGLAGAMQFMSAYERPLHLAAGAFLMYLALRAFQTSQSSASGGESPGSIVMTFAGAVLLTLTNPPTIVSFVAIFAALVPAGFNVPGALDMASGVFAGSLLWWVGVSTIVAGARHALGPRARRWIDRCSAAALGLLGAAEFRHAL